MFRATLRLHPDKENVGVQAAPYWVNIFEFETEDARDAFMEGVTWALTGTGMQSLHTCDLPNDERCFPCEEAAIHAMFVQTLATSAGSYEATEAANAASVG